MSGAPSNPTHAPVPVGTGGLHPEERWPGLADCRRCRVRGRGLFSALRGPDFDQLFLPVRTAGFPRGTVLYREGQHADAVFALRDGTVKLSKHTSDGEERIVRLLGRGAAMGLEALTHGVYWHTAEALCEVELCRIPLAVFDVLQSRNARLSDQVVGQWQAQVHCADRWLAELSAGPVHERVRRLLRFLAELDGDNGHRLQLPSTPDLANILGTTRESVSRSLAELKRRGALTHVAPHTYDCDLEALS
jgi:CRP-like cAMP-binding protein